MMNQNRISLRFRVTCQFCKCIQAFYILAKVLLKIQVFCDVTLSRWTGRWQRCRIMIAQNIRNYMPNHIGIISQNSSTFCAQAAFWTTWNLLSDFISGLTASTGWDHYTLVWTLHRICELCILHFLEFQVSAAVPEVLKLLLTLMVLPLALHMDARDALSGTWFILQNISQHWYLPRCGTVTDSAIFKIQATNN